MKKIIKHGKVSPRSAYNLKLTCPKCECEFTFGFKDIEKLEKHIGGKAWIHCPDCGKEIEFIPNEHFIDDED